MRSPKPASEPADAISDRTAQELQALGVTNQQGLVPSQLFNWGALLTWTGLLVIVGGGFLVGFGTRYADGCTSGHSIMGLANLERSSLIATVAFFAGGLAVTHVFYPLLFG